MSGETAYTECSSCGMEASGRHSLPVDHNGDFVASDYAGDWAAVPACKGCYDVHHAAGPVALHAHVQATAELRDRVRQAVDELRKATRDTYLAAESVERTLRLVP